MRLSNGSLRFSLAKSPLNHHDKRRILIDHLAAADNKQARADGGRFIADAKFVELINAVTRNGVHGVSLNDIILQCVKMGFAVPEELKVKNFIQHAVDSWQQRDGSTAENKVREATRHMKFRKDASGRKYYTYLGEGASIKYVIRYAKQTLGVPPEQIMYAPEVMPGVLQICFADEHSKTHAVDELQYEGDATNEEDDEPGA